MTDQAYCPHCGAELDSEDLGYLVSIASRVDVGQDTCWNCGKLFHFERYVRYTYHTRPVHERAP